MPSGPVGRRGRGGGARRGLGSNPGEVRKSPDLLLSGGLAESHEGFLKPLVGTLSCPKGGRYGD